MTWKQIEKMRELRLWIGQIIVPVVTTSAVIMANPEARNCIKQKATNIKNTIKSKFQKKEES